MASTRGSASVATASSPIAHSVFSVKARPSVNQAKAMKGRLIAKSRAPSGAALA